MSSACKRRYSVRENRQNRRMAQAGLCECGCGQKTAIASQTHRGKGWVKGQPLRFVRGHAGKRHGHSSVDGTRKPSPTYASWSAMWARCTMPGNPNYARYAAQGITVCERWRTFENFIADMGARPKGKTLDRINGSGNYEPGNCRWATTSEQSRNRVGVSQDVTHCVQGHLLEGPNLYVRPDGARICRACRAEQNRAYRRRKSEAR